MDSSKVQHPTHNQQTIPTNSNNKQTVCLNTSICILTESLNNTAKARLFTSFKHLMLQLNCRNSLHMKQYCLCCVYHITKTI